MATKQFTFTPGGLVGVSDDVVRFGPLRLWAERGLIRIEDARDGSYEIVSVHTMLYRMRAINEAIKNSSQRQKHSQDPEDAKEVRRLQGMIDAMVTVCRKAQEQGMPSDASARRDLARRLPTTVLVPAGGPLF
jgi:hypothetical protein